MEYFNQERLERWRLASWMENHCTRNSGDNFEYEKAKKHLNQIDLDYEIGIKIIVDYLEV